MSEIIEDTSIDKKLIGKLGKLLLNDRESLMQLLLGFSSSFTFKRIINCPTYPSKVTTLDLSYRKELLERSVKDNACEIAFALGYLYEAATEKANRKKYGQFFTPLPVATRAVSHIALRRGESLIDPGSGTGVFPATLYREMGDSSQEPNSIRYLGIENSSLLALSSAVSLDWFGAPREWRILYSNFIGRNIGDEIKEIMGSKIDAVICNPPFVRFHRLGERSLLQEELDLIGFSGLHSYFLARSSKLLNDGRMLFVVPTEMNGTRYGSSQLVQLKKRFRQLNEAVFYNEEQHSWESRPANQISLDMHTKIRKIWALTYFESDIQNKVDIISSKKIEGLLLRQIADVHRGISTGANGFFVLTSNAIKEIEITEEDGYVVKIIPTRIPQSKLSLVFSMDDWKNLEKEDKPCWLLSVSPKKSLGNLPMELRGYISKGRGLGIHETPTSKSRYPWYCVKTPKRAPDMFFTYISRGLPRFIYNKAKVQNLTNLLGIFLHESFAQPSDECMVFLAQKLNESIENWFKNEPVGRRYKGGIVKVEPKDLQSMPIPRVLTEQLRSVTGLFTL